MPSITVAAAAAHVVAAAHVAAAHVAAAARSDARATFSQSRRIQNRGRPFVFRMMLNQLDLVGFILKRLATTRDKAIYHVPLVSCYDLGFLETMLNVLPSSYVRQRRSWCHL